MQEAPSKTVTLSEEAYSNEIIALCKVHANLISRSSELDPLFLSNLNDNFIRIFTVEYEIRGLTDESCELVLNQFSIF